MSRAVRLAALIALACGCSSRPSGPTSLVLVTIDTLRRDHLDLHGYGRETAPRLRALAREGVTFANAVTPIPKTAPALSSLLTGRYPKHHEVRHNLTDSLPADVHTLAETLAARGYATAAFVGNWVLSRKAEVPVRLDRGFAEYDDRLEKAEAKRPKIFEQPAEPLTNEALAWLESRPKEPFFLWVHYMDPHGPYDPPEPWRSRFHSAEPSWIPEWNPQRDFPSPVFYLTEWNLLDGPDRHDLNLHVDRYDGEIAYADHEIGRLLDALRAHGLLDRTLVVATADHGESFGEHGVYFEHGLDLYDENVRVPLVVRLPGGERAGTTVAERVQLCDVMPTVLDLLDVPLVEPFDGRSLRDALEGRRLADAPVHLETNEGTGLTMEWPKGLLEGEWKCILGLRQGEDPHTPIVARTQLFDLRSDPQEKNDVSSRETARADAMRQRILAFVAGGVLDERRSRLEAGAYFGAPDRSPPRGGAVNVLAAELEATNEAEPREDARIADLRDRLLEACGGDRALFADAAPPGTPSREAVRALLVRVRRR
jgi:arylsulfatase A-like enzyme